MERLRHPLVIRIVYVLLLLVLFLSAKEIIEHTTDEDIPPQPVAAEAAIPAHAPAAPAPDIKSISDTLRDGESLYVVLQKHDIDPDQYYPISQATHGVYDLKSLRPSMNYIINTTDGMVSSLVCQVSQDETLNVERDKDGAYSCKLIPVVYEHRIVPMGGEIHGSLVESMSDVVVALEISEIFAWDIDFTTDIRAGDTYRAVVEELWHDGKFVKHGRILAAEFTNNGTTYEAYRFEENGRADYYDARGRSLRRAFLKAPLNYKRISSGYGIRRHPITKRVEMHRGIDYAAPTGTPVSAVGDGIVEYAGYKGPNGNLIIIRHPNGYRTYYLHLHRISKLVRRGRRVVQGQVIGTVGATGRATGPHLDYRIKKGRKFVNPLKLHIPKAAGVSKALLAKFNSIRARMDAQLSAISVNGSVHVASAGHKE